MTPAQEYLLKSRKETGHSTSIIGSGTAVPPLKLSQEDVLGFILKNFNIKPSTRSLYKRTLSNPAIHTRHFALENLSDVLDKDHDRVNARFEKEAAQLSAASLSNALMSARLSPKDIDYIAVTTCTGYICPGLAPNLIEKAHLKHDVHYADLVGMGCAAAIPAIEQAYNFTKANPGSIAAVVATEICSAAMFSNDDIDIVVSNSIFADGSAALILSSFPNVSIGNPASFTTLDPRLRHSRMTPIIKNFASLVVPEWRETLRFKTEQGHLKNVLGKDVPLQAGQAIKKLAHRLLSDNALAAADVTHWMIHPGGERILQEAEKVLNLSREQTQASWDILRDFGNMSSASILFVLQKEMEIHPPKPGTFGFLCSFGAGFSAHAALVEF